MATFPSNQQKSNLVYRLFLILSLALCSYSLTAQQTANFSGEWIQDNSKSDPQFKDYILKHTITQTPQVFTVRTAFFDKSGTETSSSSESYNLDGKEVKVEQFSGIDVMSSSWSADKKILTTRLARTVEGVVYGSTVSYALSNNGQTLTITTMSLQPGMEPIIQVLNKK